MRMPLGLSIMAGIGLATAALGAPVLLRPAAVRRLLGLRDTPPIVYVLRIAGTMLTALGLILLVFALLFWRAAA